MPPETWMDAKSRRVFDQLVASKLPAILPLERCCSMGLWSDGPGSTFLKGLSLEREVQALPFYAPIRSALTSAWFRSEFSITKRTERSMTLQRIVALGVCLTAGLAPAQTATKPASPPPAKADAGTPKAEMGAPGSAPATAPTAAAPAGVRPESPCKQDIETFCSGIQHGMGRLYQCLTEKENELSNSCKARLANLRATGGECKGDIEKFCASVPHTRGMLAKCLSEHHDELSEGCKTLSVRAKGGAPPTAAVAAPATVPAAAPAAPSAPASAPTDAGKR